MTQCRAPGGRVTCCRVVTRIERHKCGTVVARAAHRAGRTLAHEHCMTSPRDSGPLPAAPSPAPPSPTATAPGGSAPAPRRRLGCAGLVLALVVLAALGLWIVGRGTVTLGGLFGIGAEETRVTHDIVIDRVRTVAKLVSSEATVRDVVVYENTRFGSTKRSLVVVTGRLLAGVDLGTDGAAATVNIDHEARRIDIALPPAQLLAVEVVTLRTYDERAGLWNPFRPDDRDAIQQQVREQLERAGNETGLLERADRSAATLLETLLAQDGYTVTVTRRSPAIVAPTG